jgi:hypothetical protein
VWARRTATQLRPRWRALPTRLRPPATPQPDVGAAGKTGMRRPSQTAVGEVLLFAPRPTSSRSSPELAWLVAGRLERARRWLANVAGDPTREGRVPLPSIIGLPALVMPRRGGGAAAPSGALRAIDSSARPRSWRTYGPRRLRRQSQPACMPRKVVRPDRGHTSPVRSLDGSLSTTRRYCGSSERHAFDFFAGATCDAYVAMGRGKS